MVLPPPAAVGRALMHGRGGIARCHVYLPGRQVCDGHGGRAAAAACEKQLIPLMKKQHDEVASTLGAAARGSTTDGEGESGDGAQAELKAKLADRNNWMGNAMDTAIAESFRVMDLEVKKYTTAGTTCSVIICRE